MIRILHLDDEMAMPLALSRALKQNLSTPTELRAVRSERDLKEALRQESDLFDCVVVDLSFEERLGNPALSRNGIHVIADLRASGFSKPLVMLSASDDPAHMSLAMTAGATEYLSKADSLAQICLTLFRCARKESTDESYRKDAELPDGVVGETMRLLSRRMEKVVQNGLSPVLVRGESGTGKEGVADLLEALLRKNVVSRNSPFVRVNCATLQGDLLESELFGHEKGAFTGAERARVGLFEAAQGGWIFLDEVAKLSSRAQASLLRVLESGDIRPLGASKAKRIDVRVIAATNENLEDLCRGGDFRFDLLSRLQGYVVELPPYRDRSLSEREEIIDFLLQRLSHYSRSHSLASAVRQMLLKAPFCQSNIRELWHVLQAATVEASEGVINVASLPRYFLERVASLGVELSPIRSQASASSVNEQFMPARKQDVFSDKAHLMSYPDLELAFFEKTLQERGLLSPDGRLESVRKIAEELDLGRHIVARKLDELYEMRSRQEEVGGYSEVKMKIQRRVRPKG